MHIHKTTLLPDRLIWSSWVRTELTTRMASEGSVPAWQAFLAAVRLSTYTPENSLTESESKSMKKCTQKL